MKSIAVHAISTSYFACLQCRRKFHKECVESPLAIKHPSHPFHSLQLYNSTLGYKKCICCKANIYGMCYHCTTCELSMHPVCAMEPVPFVVDHPKSHPHPLTFFPTQTSTVCNICAQIKKLDPTYICIQCVFVIHKSCMGFPHVIRISRHDHRISFTSTLPSGKLSCGVCHQEVDNNYGAYSCNKCAAYFVHSKCAINRYVWDGKELEGVPEEDDMIDDGEPLKRIADGIILHPFHSHHLRLEISEDYDANKYCRGCALPIYEGRFYSCIECNYILHESCANAPRMKRHPSYPHPLTLKVANGRNEGDTGVFCCSECERDGTGFFYEFYVDISRKGSSYKITDSFKLDLRCASIKEPFEYQGHEHPLFLLSNHEEETPCPVCKYESKSKLVCFICDYSICFGCATLPYKTRYKHDSHFLTICDGKEASDQLGWCEICESRIKELKLREKSWGKRRESRIYNCSDCCTTIHAECLLGGDMYMKPGNSNTEEDYISVFKYPYRSDGTDLRIILNNTLSRPTCQGCMSRCPFPILFKRPNIIFCSVNCILSLRRR